MYRIKYFIIFLLLMLPMQPVFSVEEITESYSQSFSDFSDFTGENFFKSKFEISEERAQKVQQQRKAFNQQFLVSHWGRLSFHRNKTVPPFKIVRLKIVDIKNKICKKYGKQPEEVAEDSLDEDLNDEILNEGVNINNEPETADTNENQNTNGTLNANISKTESVSENSNTNINQNENKNETVSTNSEETANENTSENQSETETENTVNQDENTETQVTTAEKTEDVNEVLQEEAIEEVQIMVKCRTMKYLPETNEMEAVGNVEIRFPTQSTRMYAERMTYNNMTGIVQLFDNVKLERNGHEVFGDYIKVDLNEEFSKITNAQSSAYSLDFKAENGYIFGDKIIAENGKITSTTDDIIYSQSSGFGDDTKRIIVPEEDLAFLIHDVDSNKFLLKVDEMNITAKASHDKIQLKHPKIYSNKTGKKILSLPSMTFYTNKEGDYFEGNYPELGSLSAFGMFLGPGVVLETPFGSTLKLMPTVNYKDRFGFGGMARFASSTNMTDFGYSTASRMAVLKGIQRLDDNLYFQYGMNTYMDSWFLGKNWLGYGGEVAYEKGYQHKDFLYKNANATYRHRIGAGLFRENEMSTSGKKYARYNDSFEFRLKYMAEYSQKLYSMFGGVDTTYYDGWKQVDFSIVSQGSAAIYGDGGTQFIGRIGPRLSTQYKNWRQDLGYFASAFEDESSFRRFDRYRYGRANVYAREYLRLHKYLTLGLYASYVLREYDRRINRDPLVEATFYVAVGPDDFKLNLGYDWVRENAYFGLSMAMNTKDSSVEYKKMTIKNPEKLGKSNRPSNEVFLLEFVPPPSPYRSKAKVIDLEDTSSYMKGEPL